MVIKEFKLFNKPILKIYYDGLYRNNDYDSGDELFEADKVEKINLLNKAFEFLCNKEQGTRSHNVYRILGIKFKFLKKENNKEKERLKSYYNQFKTPQAIPCADGNLRLLQVANAAFLKEFDILCQKLEIKYWMDWGTLLGAVRHNGFIPWDDDLDIGMMRDDYNKLIAYYSTQNADFQSFIIHFANNGRNSCFLKVAHKSLRNLVIDIFPYDFYYKKTDIKEKKTISNKLKKLIKPNFLKKKMSEKEIVNYFINKTNTIILKNNKYDISLNPSIFVGIDFPHSLKNWVYDWDDLFPLKYQNFDGFLLLAPNQMEKMLINMFGDWNTLPKDVYPRHSSYMSMDEKEVENLKTYINKMRNLQEELR